MANLSSELFTSTAIQNIPIETYFILLFLSKNHKARRLLRAGLNALGALHSQTQSLQMQLRPVLDVLFSSV